MIVQLHTSVTQFRSSWLLSSNPKLNRKMSQVEEAYPPTFDNKETSSSIGFDWSLKPCTIFLKLFTGIRLNWTGKESVFFTVLFAVYSLFILLSNLLITITLYIFPNFQVEFLSQIITAFSKKSKISIWRTSSAWIPLYL